MIIIIILIIIKIIIIDLQYKIHVIQYLICIRNFHETQLDY